MGVQKFAYKYMLNSTDVENDAKGKGAEAANYLIAHPSLLHAWDPSFPIP
jgi:hypothetical protein